MLARCDFSTSFNNTPRPMPTTRQAAGLLVDALQAAGVPWVFTLSGNQILSIYDACIGTSVKLIHVRHEAAAVSMADAWGRLTGQPGLALLTAGPGHANGLSALYVAQQAESPLVALSGHCPLAKCGRGGFQEMPQAELAAPLCKASWTVTSPQHLGHELARAFRLARAGRPGPVHLSLPGDVLERSVEVAADTVPSPEAFDAPAAKLGEMAVQATWEILEAARRPLILAGPALTRGSAPPAINALSDTVQAPAICTESPRGVNDPSLGDYAGALAEADVVLLMGKKLDWTLRFGDGEHMRAGCRIVQIDADRATLREGESNAGAAGHDYLGFQADPLAAIGQLAASPAGLAWPQRSDWLEEVEQAVCFRPPEWETAHSSETGVLHPAELCRALRPDLSAGDVFVSDGGEFGQWGQALLSAGNRVINGPSGSIGGSLPFALAARLAFPNARVLATLGDGTFGFHAMEFDTAVRHNLPLVAVIGNDACWNAENQLQIRLYGADRRIACDLLPTRYDQLAQALGGHGEFVTRAEELPAALQRAFASGKPACVNVMTQPIAAPTIARRGG